jgi:hypothetical protein
LPSRKPCSTAENTPASRDSASAADTAFSPPATISVTRRDILSASTSWRLAIEICEAGALASDSERTTSSSWKASRGTREMNCPAVSARLSTCSSAALMVSAAWDIGSQVSVTFSSALATPRALGSLS